MVEKILIGSRKSALAVVQAELVKNAIINSCGMMDIDIKTMLTTGDRKENHPLADIGGKGLFTKELEEELLAGTIDIAVHSAKDMPAECPEGLIIAATLEREDARDAILSRISGYEIETLPSKSVVGTSSVRRMSQIQHIRSDVKIVPFRGNVIKRLAKLEQGEVDATILAVAGLKRLHIPDNIYHPISMDTMLPAVGQGALAIQCRADDAAMLEILSKINHQDSYICLQAERAFLAKLDGSCKTPLAAFATLDNDSIYLRAMVANVNTGRLHFTERQGEISSARLLGEEAADELKTLMV